MSSIPLPLRFLFASSPLLLRSFIICMFVGALKIYMYQF